MARPRFRLVLASATMQMSLCAITERASHQTIAAMEITTVLIALTRKTVEVSFPTYYVHLVYLLTLCLHVQSVCVCVCVCVCVFDDLFSTFILSHICVLCVSYYRLLSFFRISVAVCVCVCLSLYLSLQLSVFLYVSLFHFSVSLSHPLSVSMSDSFCLSFCLCVSLFLFLLPLFLYLCLCLYIVCLSLSLYFYHSNPLGLGVCLILSRSLCVSILHFICFSQSLPVSFFPFQSFCSYFILLFFLIVCSYYLQVFNNLLVIFDFVPLGVLMKKTPLNLNDNAIYGNFAFSFASSTLS